MGIWEPQNGEPPEDARYARSAKTEGDMSWYTHIYRKIYKYIYTHTQFFFKQNIYLYIPEVPDFGASYCGSSHSKVVLFFAI